MAESVFAQCQRITKRYGSRFYQASTLLPLPQRQAACAVYAFCRVTDNLADEPLSNRAEHFARWRQAVQAGLDGRPANPVLAAFIQTVLDFSIPAKLPLDVLDGVAKDLNFQGFATLSDLEQYSYQVASVPGLMVTRVLGAKAQADAYAVKLGLAMQLTNIVRDVAEDAKLGRVYLPEDLLAEFGATPADVIENKAPHETQAVLRILSAKARDHYASAKPGLALVPRSTRACAVACLSSYAKILETPKAAVAQTL
ncbi:phytoene/squalene synthase family protein [Candidatus Micrarchaeota archaeon]|nr:phytoene/squalene synthase family protein [Candidatus Micrarchaeota archaeon]